MNEGHILFYILVVFKFLPNLKVLNYYYKNKKTTATSLMSFRLHWIPYLAYYTSSYCFSHGLFGPSITEEIMMLKAPVLFFISLSPSFLSSPPLLMSEGHVLFYVLPVLKILPDLKVLNSYKHKKTMATSVMSFRHHWSQHTSLPVTFFLVWSAHLLPSKLQSWKQPLTRKSGS